MTATRGPIALKQKARLLPADMDTPISLFMGMAGAGDGILLESAAVDGRWGRYSILACDMLLYVSCQNGLLRLSVEGDRLSSPQERDGLPFAEGLKTLRRQIAIEAPDGMEDLPPITRALYGYVGFEAAGLFTPKLSAVMPREEAEARLALPGTVLVLDHVYNRLCQVSIGAHREVRSAHEASVHPAEPQSLGAVLAEPCEAAFKAGVERIRAMLAQGEAIQAVPSVRFSLPWRGEAFTLYRRLRRINASPYMFYMRFPGITLLGSSPEVMVRCARNRLQLSPIAGTRRRGRDAAEDLAFEKELLADPKERAEHVMLVDLGRNDLGRVAARGTVKVDRLMQVERFSHVMHMTSHISALIRQGLDPVDVLAAAFPAGTVSGAPKIRAMEIIREVEEGPRGPYAGCIGWLGFDRDSVNLDMGIAIRSMWLKGGRLYWQAGAGIVHDSKPDLEWKEVINKTAAMRQAVSGEE